MAITIKQDMVKPIFNTRVNLGRAFEWDEMDAMMMASLVLWDDTINVSYSDVCFVPVSLLSVGDYTIEKNNMVTLVLVPNGTKLQLNSNDVYATITKTKVNGRGYEDNGIAYMLKTDRQDCSFSVVLDNSN